MIRSCNVDLNIWYTQLILTVFHLEIKQLNYDLAEGHNEDEDNPIEGSDEEIENPGINLRNRNNAINAANPAAFAGQGVRLGSA